MKITNKVFLIFFGVIATLGLFIFQTDRVYAKDMSITLDVSAVIPDFSYESSVTVNGTDIRICSIGYQSTRIINLGMYAFSPNVFSFSNKFGTTEVTQCVTVDGNTVYYQQIDGFSISRAYDFEFSSSGWINYISVDENTSLGAYAKSMAEDMAMAGYYDYDDSGWLDKIEYSPENSFFSSSLGYLQGVQYKNITPTDEFPYQIYSQISWDTAVDITDAYVQIAADVTYKKNLKTYSESMVMFKDYGLVPYSDGACTFLMSDIDNVLPGNSVTKKVDYYYVRLIKFDSISSTFLYGGWTRIDTNKFTIDTVAYDEESGDYYIDTESDSSYSDQMGIDGNYGTLDWGDLTSVSTDSFKWFFSMLKDLFDMMGSFPSMVKTVFSYLPSPYLNCLGLLLVASVILRILGR